MSIDSLQNQVANFLKSEEQINDSDLTLYFPSFATLSEEKKGQVEALISQLRNLSQNVYETLSKIATIMKNGNPSGGARKKQKGGDPSEAIIVVGGIVLLVVFIKSLFAPPRPSNPRSDFMPRSIFTATTPADGGKGWPGAYGGGKKKSRQNKKRRTVKRR